MKKKVFVISGPSGAGKSTLINYILENFKNSGLAVSCTTRKPRDGEINSVDYHFINHSDFEGLIKNNEFIEHVECYGNRYGTLKSEILNVLKHKDICILDLEFNGAHNILSKNTVTSDCSGILILPPSLKTLKNRLINRKSETEESLNKRISEAFDFENIANYQYVIINKDINDAKSEIFKIFSEY